MVGNFGQSDIGSLVHFVQIGDGFVQVQQARDDFTLAMVLFQVVHHLAAIGGIVVGRNAFESHHASVMHGNVDSAILANLGEDLIGGGNKIGGGRNKIGFDCFELVLAGVEVAFRGALVIVERYAGRDDVDQGEAAMRDGG